MTASIKSYLSRAKEAKLMMKNIEFELDDLYSRGITTSTIRDTPTSKGNFKYDDVFINIISRKEKLEKEYNQCLDILTEISEAIELLGFTHEKVILRRYYILENTIELIAEMFELDPRTVYRKKTKGEQELADLLGMHV